MNQKNDDVNWFYTINACSVGMSIGQEPKNYIVYYARHAIFIRKPIIESGQPMKQVPLVRTKEQFPCWQTQLNQIRE